MGARAVSSSIRNVLELTRATRGLPARNIFLVDPEPSRLRKIFHQQPDLAVVGQAEGPDSCPSSLPDSPQVHLIVTTLETSADGSDKKGLQFIDRIRRSQLQLPILVRTSPLTFQEKAPTGLGGPNWLVEALEAGADGLIPQDASEAELVMAVREVGNGRQYLHWGLVPNLFELMRRGTKSAFRSRPLRPVLSPRELQVLGHIASGRQTQDIAELLKLSETTVRYHLRSLMRKTDSKDRRELENFNSRPD